MSSINVINNVIKNGVQRGAFNPAQAAAVKVLLETVQKDPKALLEHKDELYNYVTIAYQVGKGFSLEDGAVIVEAFNNIK